MNIIGWLVTNHKLISFPLICMLVLLIKNENNDSNVKLVLAFLTFWDSSVTDKSFVDETRVWRIY